MRGWEGVLPVVAGVTKVRLLVLKQFLVVVPMGIVTAKARDLCLEGWMVMAFPEQVLVAGGAHFFDAGLEQFGLGAAVWQVTGTALTALDRGVEIFSLNDSLMAGTTEIELVSFQQGGLVRSMGGVAEAALPLQHRRMRNGVLPLVFVAAKADFLGRILQHMVGLAHMSAVAG